MFGWFPKWTLGRIEMLFLEQSGPVFHQRQRLGRLLLGLQGYQETSPVRGDVVQITALGYHRAEQRPHFPGFEGVPFNRHLRRHQPAVRRYVEDLLPVAPPARMRAARDRNPPPAASARKLSHVDLSSLGLVGIVS